MKIGLIGASDIAFRRFLPALKKCTEIEYIGVASRSLGKSDKFKETFGGKIYSSYESLLNDNNVDAVYVSLPPALHFEWGKKVLLSGKHLLMEKPFTISFSQTKELLEIAKNNNLAVHENYMFLYHNQMKKIKEIINNGDLGELRLIRMAFGFPKRAEGDFRYNKALGGGALFDCGGYPVRLALDLLGEDIRATQARLIQPHNYSIDLYGNAVLESNNGLCAQITFGMDNSYKCELEIWGSKANLFTNRIFTAPPEFAPKIEIQEAKGERAYNLDADNSFMNSIRFFLECIKDNLLRIKETSQIKKQAELIESINIINAKGETQC
ncbi:MAG: Gfo/Idh/MocA family oxidoreductase [Spirochaetia bacterium]|nr:Gfo/Idh/MocA family oxidoreductase [Spirochaetia bacterium]